jgi:hypothetical protein
VRISLAYVAFAVGILAVLNFLLFAADSIILGGDAVSGYQRDGTCYVGYKGAVHPVPCNEWYVSKALVGALFITFPLAMVGGTYSALLTKYGLGWRQGKDVRARVRSVRNSGSPLTQVRCSGAIAGVESSMRWLRVSIYPRGVVVEIDFLPPTVILQSEIRRVEEGGPTNGRILVHHVSPDLKSPLELRLATPRPLLDSLGSFVRERPGAADSI